MNPKLPERIFICGFMGAGKSTIGRLLAQKIDFSFCDLDEFIEEQAGLSIGDIFAKYGEKGFRLREEEALFEITHKNNDVIALGGGSLQNQHIVDHIKMNGLLVFIQISLNTILQRIASDKTRPLLRNKNGELKPKAILKEDLKRLYESRMPFYRQADVILDGDNHPSEGVLVTQLVKEITTYAAN